LTGLEGRLSSEGWRESFPKAQTLALRYFIVPIDFSLDSSVDFVLSAESDAVFLQRYKDSFLENGYYNITYDQTTILLNSVRNGVSVGERLRAAFKAVI
jgi:hypothetical protein